MAAPVLLDYACPREPRTLLQSLFEPALVVVILAILAAVVVPKFTATGCGSSRYAAAQADISGFAMALKDFRRDVGRYPTAAEGLAVLLVPPASARGWRGPYLQRLPVDPWGNPYVYVPATGSTPPRVISAGPDGVQGNADDLAPN